MRELILESTLVSSADSPPIVLSGTTRGRVGLRSVHGVVLPPRRQAGDGPGPGLYGKKKTTAAGPWGRLGSARGSARRSLVRGVVSGTAQLLSPPTTEQGRGQTRRGYMYVAGRRVQPTAAHSPVCGDFPSTFPEEATRVAVQRRKTERHVTPRHGENDRPARGGARMRITFSALVGTRRHP